ncbi:hypothetical protein KU75_06440 [Pectobacterium odoriferum]|uniref:Aminotransferase class I/classII domain-containing protein n=1 Tax=Pectobacterium odoriferum TaxID=78398 RepID=A0ABR4VSR8_9GAMM|nr:hypothetical protein KU75_06440 [Pectobacterium odoriferum]
MRLLRRKDIELDLRGDETGTTIRMRRVFFGVFRRTIARIVMYPGINGSPSCIRISLRNSGDIDLLEALLDSYVALMAALEPPQTENQKAG